MEGDEMDAILEFKEVSYWYQSGGRKIPILESASCAFEKGKLHTIVGPSGCGKTTTLTLAGALEEPKGGSIEYESQDIRAIGYHRYRGSKVGIVFQSYNLLSYLTPYQNVMAAMEISSNAIKDKKGRAVALLGRMGLAEDQMHRGVNKLSGGEQQRVAIARAISTDSQIVLADEPTGNLDIETAREIIGVFGELAREDGKCVIVVTHSQEFAEAADAVIRLEGRRLVPETVIC